MFSKLVLTSILSVFLFGCTGGLEAIDSLSGNNKKNDNDLPIASFEFSCSYLDCSFTNNSGDPDGSIESHSWEFGDGLSSSEQSPSHSFASAGNYTVKLTVTDDDGDSASISKQVSVQAEPNPEAPVANFTFSCDYLACVFTSTSSDPDGTITNYAWEFGDNSAAGSPTATTQNKTYAQEGSYAVKLTVTDNDGLQNTFAQTVTVEAQPVPPVANFSFACTYLECNFADGSTDSDGSIASYSWDFGDSNSSTAQNPNHTFAAAGTYQVELTVTDDEGLSNSIIREVTVEAEPVAPVANFTVLCNFLTCNFTDNSSDSDGNIASYSWDFGDGNNSSSQSPSHTYASAGTYQVKLTVADDDGLQHTFSQDLTVSAQPVPPVANFSSSCTYLDCNFADGSTDSDGSIASYSWSFGDGNNSTAKNPSHSYASPGTYQVELTVTDNQGLSHSQTKPITVEAAPVAPVANFTVSCNFLACNFTDTSTDADGSIASRSWNFGDGNNSTTRNPNHTYSSAGSYTVSLTVTDSDGLTHTVQKPVTVDSQPVAPVADFTFSCNYLACNFTDGSIDTDGNIASRSWNFGDGNNSTATNPSHTFAASGSYSVSLTVTDNDGLTHSKTKTVTVEKQMINPVANFTFSCNYLACNFTDASNDSDGSIASRSWSFGDGNNSTATNPSHTFAAAGSYSVRLTVTDNDGLTHSRTKTVTVEAQPVAPVANFTFSCNYLACNFTDASNDSDGSIASRSWNFGDGNTSTAANPSHTFAAAGSYSVRLTVTDNDGLTHSRTKTVTVEAQPVAPVANFTFNCDYLACNFTDASNDSDGNIASRSWNFGDGNTSTATNPSHTFAAAGSYSVRLTVTDNDGLTHSRTKTVTVDAQPVAPVANFTFSCNYLACNFTDASSDSDGSVQSYSWNFGDGQSTSTQNPSHSYSSAGTYTVVLTVTDNDGLTHSRSKSVTVENEPNIAPVANFTFSCNYTSCDFTDASSDSDGTVQSYSWNFGDGQTSNAQSPSHSFSTGGTYNVSLTVTDNDGGTHTRTKPVVVEDVPPPQLVTIKVVATDTAGQETTKEIQVTVDQAESLGFQVTTKK